MSELNETQKFKIQKFLDDEVMSQTIYDVLFSEFLKPAGKEIQFLAASRIAIDSLNESWKKLETFRKEKETESSQESNIGL